MEIAKRIASYISANRQQRVAYKWIHWRLIQCKHNEEKPNKLMKIQIKLIFHWQGRHFHLDFVQFGVAIIATNSRLQFPLWQWSKLNQIKYLCKTIFLLFIWILSNLNKKKSSKSASGRALPSATILTVTMNCCSDVSDTIGLCLMKNVMKMRIFFFFVKRVINFFATFYSCSQRFYVQIVRIKSILILVYKNDLISMQLYIVWAPKSD